MAERRQAKDFEPGVAAQVRATCLYVATKLHDVLEQMVVVGGLVPQLLVDPTTLPPGAPPHVGTSDLDLGLAVAVLREEDYESLRDRLREAGLHPGRNEKGNETRQRWVLDELPGVRITVDFLVPRTESMDEATLQPLTEDLAAIRTKGLEFAFEDQVKVPLRGRTIRGAEVTTPIEVPVCGPAAFLLLKLRAFRGRAKDKDAYDLFWLVKHYPGGLSAFVEVIRRHRGRDDLEWALNELEDRFFEPAGLGPVSVATFLFGRVDENVQREVAGVMRALLHQVREG